MINFIRRYDMSLYELESYYCEQRKKDYKKGMGLKYIKQRKLIYPIFRLLLRLDRMFRRQIIIVMRKPNLPKQVILACTHIAQNDLENIYETCGQSCYWLVGDPCVLYKEFSGLLVSLNGSIFLETCDKEDRQIAYFRAVELLKKGGSLMIYPEGARNGFESVPVMPLFKGTSNMALETGVAIVPVAIEQYNNRFVINYGEVINPNDFSESVELTKTLRNALATLKWEIWEKEEVQVRKSMSNDYKQTFISEFEERIFPYDSLESVERTRYHTKEEIEQNEVSMHLDKVVPSKDNAFLYRGIGYVNRKVIKK